jgi:hypothetical protein
MFIEDYLGRWTELRFKMCPRSAGVLRNVPVLRSVGRGRCREQLRDLGVDVHGTLRPIEITTFIMSGVERDRQGRSILEGREGSGQPIKESTD